MKNKSINNHRDILKAQYNHSSTKKNNENSTKKTYTNKP